MIPGSANPLLLGQTGTGGFSIERSLRFNSGDSAYLNRTPGSAGNRKTWTWSGWVKLGNMSASGDVFAAKNGSNYDVIKFESGGKIRVYFQQTTNGELYTVALLRDPSAWYHLHVAFDTTQATSTNRFKLYLNGTLQDLTGTYPGQNIESYINGTYLQTIGRGYNDSTYFNGYLADVHFIDGQALAPTDFGETDDNNVWQPKEFDGTYGPLVDQSQTWSNLVSTTDGLRSGSGAFAYGALSTIFDGNLANGVGTNSGNLTLNFSSGISTSNSTVEVYIYHTYSATITAGGSTYATNTGTSGVTSWVSVSGVSGTITSIVVSGSGSVGTCGGIKIDGKLLVDSGVTVPDNSFHLDFKDNSSNAALGTDTSGNSNTWTVNNLSVGVGDYSISGGSNYLNREPADMFDGSTSTYWQAAASGDRYQLMTFPTPKTGTTIELSVLAANGWDGFQINGTVPSSLPSAGSQSWYNITSHTSGSLSSIRIAYTTGVQTQLVYALRINGTIVTGQTQTDPSSNDSLVDTPSNGTASSGDDPGGSIVGNYATMNPLAMASGLSLSNGNLDAAGAAVYGCVTSTIFASSGKYYFEYTLNAYHNDAAVGVVTTDANPNADYLGAQASSVGYLADGRVFYNASLTHTFSSYAAGDVIGVAFDVDTGKIWFAKNNTWLNSGDPAAGSNPVTTISSGKPLGAGYRGVGSGAGSFNFGQRAFSNSNVPSGYKSLNTANLPEPTIADGSKYFDTKLWTGTGVNPNNITGLSFSPDWVWIKQRSGTRNNAVYDTIRGVTKELFPDESSQENTLPSGLTSFNPDGFTVSTNSRVNQAGNTYVGWTWDGGTSTVTNNDGSIASQVRANPTAGFSIVGWTGTGAGSASVGHGLSSKPGFIIIKQRIAGPGSDLYNWNSYHSAIGATKFIALNTTSAQATAPLFSDTEPTNSVFSLGSTTSNYQNVNNASSVTYIAYCFAPVAGYSAMGSYSSGSDPFVFTGFLPRFVLLKKTNAVGHWYMFDSKRGPINPNETWLEANGSGAEQTHANGDIRFLSNGFQPIGSDIDASSGSYIYYAVAENPFQANGGLAR